MKKTPIINKLDKVFSEYVRRYYADHTGWVQCATCDGGNHWKGMQNGHFQSRRFKATRWDFRNVLPQDARCNTFNQGEQFKMAKAIDSTHGEGTAEEMELLARTGKAPTTHEMLELIDFFKKKLDSMV